MNFRRLLLAGGLLAIVVLPSFAQAPFDASRLKVSWEVVENHYQGKDQFLSVYTIVNTSKTPLPARGWQLYFNFVRFIRPGATAGNVSASHINGDLYKLTPTADSKGIAPGDSLRIELVADAW